MCVSQGRRSVCNLPVFIRHRALFAQSLPDETLKREGASDGFPGGAKMDKALETFFPTPQKVVCERSPQIKNKWWRFFFFFN